MEQNTTPSLDGKKIDRDTFQRVWDRVMPDQTNSPITVERREESTQTPGAAVPAESAPAPEPEPEQPESGQQEPTLPQVPVCSDQGGGQSGCACTGTTPLCLGEESSGDTRCLEELMSMARWGMMAGQSLSCRSGGYCAKAMSALACDHRLAQRRLSAAYFLITGKRFRPRCPAPELPSSVCLALREQFMWEQRWEHCNRQAAENTKDPCLKALYEELAQEGKLHAGTIRSLLEQMT